MVISGDDPHIPALGIDIGNLRTERRFRARAAQKRTVFPKRFGVDRQSLRTAVIGDRKSQRRLICLHPVRQLHILIPAVFSRLGGCGLLFRPDDERHFVNADAAAVLQPPLIHIAADGRHILIECAFLVGVQLGELVPLRIVLVPGGTIMRSCMAVPISAELDHSFLCCGFPILYVLLGHL